MTKRLWMAIGILFFTTSLALAQTSRTVVGNVHDTTGAQVAGATITVTSVERGTSQTVVSGQDGNYVVPFLPPGTYRISIERPASRGSPLRPRSWTLTSVLESTSL